MFDPDSAYLYIAVFPGSGLSGEKYDWALLVGRCPSQHLHEVDCYSMTPDSVYQGPYFWKYVERLVQPYRTKTTMLARFIVGRVWDTDGLAARLRERLPKNFNRNRQSKSWVMGVILDNSMRIYEFLTTFPPISQSEIEITVEGWTESLERCGRFMAGQGNNVPTRNLLGDNDEGADGLKGRPVPYFD